eukprot:COSAG06_NODE_50552_length_318_cov_0.570776_1_plen_100_part_01
MFGPLQLWSKPQPGGGAAVLVASIGSAWGNDNTRSSAANFALSEIPGLPQVSKQRLLSLWLLRARPLASLRVDYPCGSDLACAVSCIPSCRFRSASALRK